MTQHFSRKLGHSVAAGFLVAFLGACQTTPPGQGFSEEQIAVLSAAGFQDSGDTWGLDLNNRILFKTDSVDLTEKSREIVGRISQALVSIDIQHVQLEGHTDTTGNEAYNKKLALKRAKVVAQEMSQHGMPIENIKTRSFGSTKPIADNRTKDGRLQNRRVAIIVSLH